MVLQQFDLGEKRKKVLSPFQNTKRALGEDENLMWTSPNSIEINVWREFCSLRDGLAKT